VHLLQREAGQLFALLQPRVRAPSGKAGRTTATHRKWIRVKAGANPTITSYNARAVKVYNATGNLARFRNKNTFNLWNYVMFVGQQPLVPFLLLGPPFFPIILFGSTTLLTGMTGISLHMQWPLTSQLHGSISQREQ
jgi:hypothetical protein